MRVTCRGSLQLALRLTQLKEIEPVGKRVIGSIIVTPLASQLVHLIRDISKGFVLVVVCLPDVEYGFLFFSDKK